MTMLGQRFGRIRFEINSLRTRSWGKCTCRSLHGGRSVFLSFCRMVLIEMNRSVLCAEAIQIEDWMGWGRKQISFDLKFLGKTLSEDALTQGIVSRSWALRVGLRRGKMNDADM